MQSLCILLKNLLPAKGNNPTNRVLKAGVVKKQIDFQADLSDEGQTALAIRVERKIQQIDRCGKAKCVHLVVNLDCFAVD